MRDLMHGTPCMHDLMRHPVCKLYLAFVIHLFVKSDNIICTNVLVCTVLHMQSICTYVLCINLISINCTFVMYIKHISLN